MSTFICTFVDRVFPIASPLVRCACLFLALSLSLQTLRFSSLSLARAAVLLLPSTLPHFSLWGFQIGHRLAGGGAAAEADGKAGVLVRKKVGERVEDGGEVAVLLGSDKEGVEREVEAMLGVFEIQPTAPLQEHVPTLISYIVTAAGAKEWGEYLREAGL